MEALVKLSDKAGLHGRPGALLVQLAQKNPEIKIILEKNGKKSEVNGILKLLALGVGKGEEVRVFVEGNGDREILEEVKAILEGRRA